MKKIKQSIIAIVIGLALAGGVSFAETVWNGPTANPPGNNTDAPINVGDKTQTKIGAMNFDGVVQFNNSITPLIIPAGAGDGKVLTSDAVGKASWRSSTGGGGVNKIKVYHFSNAIDFPKKEIAGESNVPYTSLGSHSYCALSDTDEQSSQWCGVYPEGFPPTSGKNPNPTPIEYTGAIKWEFFLLGAKNNGDGTRCSVVCID